MRQYKMKLLHGSEVLAEVDFSLENDIEIVFILTFDPLGKHFCFQNMLIKFHPNPKIPIPSYVHLQAYF